MYGAAKRLSLPAMALAMMAGMLVGRVCAPGEQGGLRMALAGNAADQEKVIAAVRNVSPAVVGVLSRTKKGRGLGSGVILEPDGLILTNNHVVASALEIRVALADGRELPAKLVVRDTIYELALIRVEARNLPTVTLGESNTLVPGQTAIAIGNPLGFTRTVTVGVVSAINRYLPDKPAEFYNLIQTDAAINPGNSGGPLIDAEGNVIGINTLVIAGPVGAGGLGFAIPIDTARAMVRDMAEYGHIRHPWLGVAYVDIDRDVAHRFSLPVADGVLVRGVAEGSPAGRAGIKQGDIIVTADGTAVKNAGDLLKALRRKDIGQAVALTLRREGKDVLVLLKLEERPAAAEAAADPAPAE